MKAKIHGIAKEDAVVVETLLNDYCEGDLIAYGIDMPTIKNIDLIEKLVRTMLVTERRFVYTYGPDDAIVASNVAPTSYLVCLEDVENS